MSLLNHLKISSMYKENIFTVGMELFLSVPQVTNRSIIAQVEDLRKDTFYPSEILKTKPSYLAKNLVTSYGYMSADLIVDYWELVTERLKEELEVNMPRYITYKGTNDTDDYTEYSDDFNTLWEFCDFIQDLKMEVDEYYPYE